MAVSNKGQDLTSYSRHVITGKGEGPNELLKSIIENGIVWNCNPRVQRLTQLFERFGSVRVENVTFFLNVCHSFVLFQKGMGRG